MAEKVKIPDFVKEGAKAAIEPLAKVEEKIAESVKKFREGSISSKEMKKVLDDLLSRIKKARQEAEKAFGDGVSKTFSLLNLPSRDDLEKLSRKVERLSKDIDQIKKKTAKKGAKKAAPKAAAKKKVAKKKAAKKSKKKAAK